MGWDVFIRCAEIVAAAVVIVVVAVSGRPSGIFVERVFITTMGDMECAVNVIRHSIWPICYHAHLQHTSALSSNTNPVHRLF